MLTRPLHPAAHMAFPGQVTSGRPWEGEPAVLSVVPDEGQWLQIVQDQPGSLVVDGSTECRASQDAAIRTLRLSDQGVNALFGNSKAPHG